MLMNSSSNSIGNLLVDMMKWHWKRRILMLGRVVVEIKKTVLNE